MRNWLLFMLGMFTLLLVGTGSAWAQYGKIAGKVVDKDTGEPLPGATVVIVGTQRGAATDANGEYVIIDVPPGTYTLRASFVGYGPQVVENVVVNSGFTTIVNFELKAGIQLEEVVVLAERLIRQDETMSVTVLQGEDIQALPIETFQDAITLAAGVVESTGGGDNGIHIRGGRTTEVAYVVDGILVQDPFDRSIGGFDVPRQSISELQILSGGFNPEYGQAMSGVIIINTPTGSTDFHGSLRFQTDGYSMEGLGKGGPSFDYKRPFSNDWGTRIFEASVSGPILGDRLTFFLNVDRQDTDTYLNEFDGPVRPAVFPWAQLVGYTFYLPIDEVTDADGNPIDLEALGITEGTVITEDIVNQLQQMGVDVNTVKAAIKDYQMHHVLGLYNDRTRLTANLGFRPTRAINLKFSYKRTRRDWRSYQHTYKWLPMFNDTQHRKVDLFSLSLTHRLSPNVFYEVKGAYHRNRYSSYLYDDELNANDPCRFCRIFSPFLVAGAFNTEGLSDGQGGSNYDFFGYRDVAIRIDYPFLLQADIDRAGNFVPLMLSRSLDLDGDGNIDVKRGDRLTAEIINQFKNLSDEDLARLGLQRGLIPVQVPPTENDFTDGITKEYQFRFDITAQVDKRNLVKAGAEVRYFDLWNYFVLANEEWDPSLPPDDPNTLRWQPYQEEFIEAKPYQFAAYIQDKLEFPNLVIQGGLRLDGIHPGVNAILQYGAGGAVRRGQAQEVPAKVRMRVSPRIGVAFPITERARLSFNYGHFFQYPEFGRLYQHYRRATWVPGQGYVPLAEPGFDLGFEEFLGNPNLKPETSVSYQIDGEFLITENLALGMSLFYKDIYDYVSLRRIIGEGGVAYWVLDNLDYANARGFEVRLEKRMTEHLGFNAAYTYSRAVGNADNYTERFSEWLQNSVFGIFPPRKAQPLDWDQPHTLTFAVNTRFDRLSVAIQGRFGSGLPYTPTSTRGRPLGPKNSARRPWTGVVDLRAEYRLQLSSLATLRPFLDITNLFNRRNVLNVFPDTGSPDFTLDPGTQYEDAQRANYIGPPRHVEVGIEISF